MIRVVVPLDGSELAETALNYLPVLRSLGPLYVRLVSVAEDGETYGVPNPREWQERQVRLQREYLLDRQEKLQTAEMKVEIGARRGNPAETIVIDARRFHADFILLSTHGRTGLKRFRIGSVADKIIRTTRTNVLAVGPEAVLWPHKSDVRSIMVPLDGSELAESALPMATRLAGELQAQLHLVRVITFMPAIELPAVDLANMTKVAEEYLAARAAERWQIAPKCEVITGTPSEALQFYSGQQNIDLVVMTSHGQGGILRAALGSVTDRMIGGTAPVLIVRRDVSASAKE